ncbi:hypothetical protein [Novipirellula sp.]|uniref:hypothetical protein n=1 Tax=Novipirellula sp. TaxID=2795430 RepID=UPI00356A8819
MMQKQYRIATTNAAVGTIYIEGRVDHRLPTEHDANSPVLLIDAMDVKQLVAVTLVAVAQSEVSRLEFSRSDGCKSRTVVIVDEPKSQTRVSEKTCLN